MNQSGTRDHLLESGGGAPPEYSLPDSDRGGAAPRWRAVAGSGVVGPAAEEITEAASSSPKNSGEAERLPDPEKEKFRHVERLRDDRPAEVRARLRKQWQKQLQRQRTSSILSVMTMDCMRAAKPPMDSNNQEELEADGFSCRHNLQALSVKMEERFDIDKLFEIVASGDVNRMHGLKDYLYKTMKPLSHSEYQSNGKTALMKALLNVSSGENEMVEYLLNVAEEMGDIEQLINSSYTSYFYKGQTALHIAIERRNTYYVKKLVEKGADLYAKACGRMFQPDSTDPSFYFGELPLSLAACTNQPELVDFLLGASANVVEQDSHGNTVLHALVMVADDDSPDNTRFITAMYDHILLATAKVNSDWRLEAVQNKQGLTPLKLAAKTGKVELFKHTLQREFKNDDTKHLSRKFTEWSYGPIHCSLYDLESLDTYHGNRSILELVVYGSDNPRRLDLLQVEPLCGLLNEKWNQFAGRLFLFHFFVYLLYLWMFTTIAYNVPELKNERPFQAKTLGGYMYLVFQLTTPTASLYLFLKGILDLMRKRPKLSTFMIDGYYDVLFSAQGLLFLVSVALYMLEYEFQGFITFSMVLSWVNLLYFARGLKRMGVYSVMIQKVITGDIIPFFLIYIIFLSGFSAAIVTMNKDQPQWTGKDSDSQLTLNCTGMYCSSRHLTNTALELFKLTVGIGDLGLKNSYKNKELLYVLLIGYIVLTYILLFNMLIALMSHTVDETAKENTRIWKLQRAITTLDLEWGLPRCVRSRLRSGVEKDLSGGGMSNEQGHRWCFRVEEVDWVEWRSNQGNIRDEPLYTPKIPAAPPLPMPKDTGRRIQKAMWTFRQRQKKQKHPLENEA